MQEQPLQLRGDYKDFACCRNNVDGRTALSAVKENCMLPVLVARVNFLGDPPHWQC